MTMDTSPIKDPMQILTAAEVIAEFRWNENFIARHAKDMGARGRPRTFVRFLVEQFRDKYYGISHADIDAALDRAKKLELLKAISKPAHGAVHGVLADLYVASCSIAPGRTILGRGGKQKGAAA
jgi:hypothetical protein